MNLQNLIDYCSLNNLASPLDGVITPDPISSETVKSYIMIRCGLLTPVYNDPNTFREACRVWFSARAWEFEHLVNILRAKYSPIENVDRYDEWTKDTIGGYKNAESGTDVVNKDITDQTSGSDVENTTRGTENTISAFNSSGYQPDNKMQDSGDLTTIYGKNDRVDDDTTTTYGHVLDNDHNDKEHYIQHLHGNVGVTSNTQLISGEIDLLERFNVYDWIASQFESDMMICVY